MAQQARRSARRSATRLGRRYGVSGRTGVALACVALLAVAAVVLVLRSQVVGSFTVERGDEALEEASVADVGDDVEDADDGGDAAAEADTVVVHVDGAVGAPGVYELPAGSRVNDAVELAGGLAEDADTTSLNLAATVEDGQKVYVPVEGEDVSATATGTTADSSSDGTTSELININTATAEELQELPGVGEATAAAIIEDREANGAFSSPEDIMRVSGIGEKKFAKMEAMICV